MHPVVATRDEAKMIACILDGDTQKYHDLIRPYELSVYRIAISFMRHKADAEEVAQEAFLKAFRNLASFRGNPKFSTWLIGIALNEARGRLRHQNLVWTVSLGDTCEEISHISPALLRGWQELPSESPERREIREILREVILSLPPIYREVVLLRDVEAFSVEETAAAVEVSQAAVRARLHNARLMLQKNLAPKLKRTARKSR